MTHPSTVADTLDAGHTPGPWSIITEDHDISISGEGWFEDQHVNGWIIVGNPSDPSFAVAVLDMGFQNSWDVDGHWDANAALVAAAPDLLAALTAIDAMWSECDGERVNPTQARSPKVREVWEAARAAIAKARGEVQP